MADYQKNETIEQKEAKEEQTGGFNLRTILSIFILYWYWIILSVIICVGAAVLYVKRQQPVYTASMKILIKDDNNRNKSRSAAATLGLEDMGIISNSNGFDNELEILTSGSISTRVVKKLKLYTSYMYQGRFRKFELYKNTPIIVDLEESKLDELNTAISLRINKAGENTIHVTGSFGESENTQIDKKITLPAHINTPAGALIFEQNPGQEMTDQELLVTITPVKKVGRAYAKNITAEPTSKTTTVALITTLDNVPERAIDFLNEMVVCYNEDANEDKNEVATKTEQFIKERINMIGGELDETEVDLEAFKKQNELINLTNDATNALTTTTEYQKKQVEIQTQLSIVKGLLEYVQNPNNAMEVIPANLGIEDQTLNTTIATYNEKVLQRNRLLKAGSENNPVLARLTEEIEGMWPSINISLRSLYDNLTVQKNGIDQQYALYTGRISNTPTQERIMNGIGRQQEIKAGLYLMLLQKREENFISLASVAAKAKVIEEPALGGKVSPKTKIILAIALLLGLALPIGIIIMIDKMRYRIQGHDDIKKMTNLSILADIPVAGSDKVKGFLGKKAKGMKQRAIVVHENSNNMMEESFRGLRTNLRFILQGDENVLLCTSCIPGEGKTFVSTNLAMSLALMGKRVIVMGLDIRKPRLVNLFGLPSDKRGITNFLAAAEADYELLEDQIHHGVMNKNLDVLPAGVIPPNPGELISRPLLGQAIEYLRTKYDYVIMDTPPVGLVSDTLEMAHLANATFVVVRADYTPKRNIEMINAIKQDDRMPKMNLVLNGVDLSKKKNGYYYGYGKYGKYGKYGQYGHYGAYGAYGKYGSENGKDVNHTEK